MVFRTHEKHQKVLYCHQISRFWRFCVPNALELLFRSFGCLFGFLLGPTWSLLGASWTLLGALGRPWGALGSLLGRSWKLLDALGRSWDDLETLLGPPRVDFRLSGESTELLQGGYEQPKRTDANSPKAVRKLSENQVQQRCTPAPSPCRWPTS